MSTADQPAVIPGVPVVTPADPEWDDARRAWNLCVDQRPVMVALPESPDHVVAAVRHAAAHGLRVAVQGTGHGAAPRGPLDGSLLLNMARMRDVSVDPAARTARVEGGALWLDVVPAAAAHGLAALHGSAADVGVAGYTLGGGIGWLGRRHGLAANQVTAVELVTPDGELRRADAATEPDLFWALRGGGGNVGVVTALEFRLLPVATVHAGWLMWPWEDAERVLGAWARWVETVPDEVTSVGRILQLPPLPDLPEWARGSKLVVVEAAIIDGDDREAELLAPLRALGPERDTMARIPAAELVHLHMDPPQPVPGIGAGSLIDALPPEAVAAFVAHAGPGSGSPLLSAEIRHLGGALDRIPEGAGALGHVDGRFLLFAVGIPMSPELGQAIPAHLDRMLAAMGEWGSGRNYLSFAERPVDTRTAFDPEAHARLAALRAAHDPGALLQPSQEIPVASR